MYDGTLHKAGVKLMLTEGKNNGCPQKQAGRVHSTSCLRRLTYL
jgi:hypothetical protein